MATVKTDIGMDNVDAAEILTPYRYSVGQVISEETQKLIEVANLYQQKYGKPTSGSTRVCFIDYATDTVIKLQRRASGSLGENVDEATIYAEHPNWPLAKCWLEPSEFDSSITVLKMELVDTTFELAELGDSEAQYSVYDAIDYMPEWVQYIDSSQVGMTKAGKLVAYDYPQLAQEYYTNHFATAVNRSESDV